jgi:hypothetical protein
MHPCTMQRKGKGRQTCVNVMVQACLQHGNKVMLVGECIATPVGA